MTIENEVVVPAETPVVEETTVPVEEVIVPPVEETTVPVETPPVKLPDSEIAARIDNMYAKLDAQIAERTTVKPLDDEDDDGPQPVTATDVSAMLDNRDKVTKFRATERRVFENHPTMLNTDGSFNLDDPFMKEYVKIGREESHLLNVPNGPAIAEAMAEKRLGLSYKKGAVDEATRQQETTIDSHTVTSTTGAPNRSAAVTGTLTPAEEKIAGKMSMTKEEYVKYRGSSKVTQRDWSK